MSYLTLFFTSLTKVLFGFAGGFFADGLKTGCCFFVTDLVLIGVI